MNPIDRPLPGERPPSPPSALLQDYEYNARNLSETSSHPINSSKYDLKSAVRLPEHEDPNEWIANNLFDFHKQLCMLFGTVSEHCTRDKCPEMTAGQHKYLWSAGTERRPVELSASEYITHSLDWIQEQLRDEEVFPSMSVDKKFPDNIGLVCQSIARRLFRVFAHVYHHHLAHVRKAKIEAHMNTSLKHFIYFVREFNLIAPNDKEWEPLGNYVGKLDIMSIANMRITN